MVAAARRIPDRLTFGNLATGEEMTAQYNPTELEETIKPEYAKLKVLGLSHEVHQYQNTASAGWKFELAFSAFADDGSKLDDLLKSRRFLHSLCYSSRSAQTVAQAVPPRVLFVWPTLISVSAVIVGLKFKFTDFSLGGAPIRMTVSVEIDEVRDERLYSEDVRANGTIRSPK